MVTFTVLRFVFSGVFTNRNERRKLMNNVIGLVRGDLERHRVSVALPGEKAEKSLYLIMINAKTSKLKDLQETYGVKATTTHVKIAKKIFGENETENVYGVLIDDDLRMVFAFNRDFADYDSKKKAVIFRDIDDVLVDRIEAKEKDSSLPLPRESGGRSFFPRRGEGSGLIKYSLAEKEQTV
jgi:hypothetical protein